MGRALPINTNKY